MTDKPQPTITVNVDVTNPGQFFACCGLLELADRLWPGAEGWFDGPRFLIKANGSLSGVVSIAAKAELTQLDPHDKTASPLEMRLPTDRIRLDWWHDDRSGGREMKVWAGSMESARIARAMQTALRQDRFFQPDLLDVGQIVYDPDNPRKKVEPFYFDARRCGNAHSRDIGFSPNDLGMTTTAHPAVEFFCLVGLQRCLPAKTKEARVYDYLLWSDPVSPELLPPVVTGACFLSNASRYRFENSYRTGQKKHKAFRSAINVPVGG